MSLTTRYDVPAARGAPPNARCTAGEAWAQEHLAALRAAGFTPPAVFRFIGASRQRAQATRGARPAIAGQARVWEVAGCCAWVTLAAAGVEPFRRRIITGLAWWASVALMLDWHLGMFETENGRARSLGPADAMTLTRAWLVPALADAPNAGLLMVAAGTDVLDGRLARATEPTRAGRDLEGLVDGAAAAAALLGARRQDALAPAAVACELTRLATGLAYATHAYLGRAGTPDSAITRASRATTPLRVAGLVAAAAGRRRSGSALLAGGSLLGLAATARRARVT